MPHKVSTWVRHGERLPNPTSRARQGSEALDGEDAGHGREPVPSPSAEGPEDEEEGDPQQDSKETLRQFAVSDLVGRRKRDAGLFVVLHGELVRGS